LATNKPTFQPAFSACALSMVSFSSHTYLTISARNGGNLLLLCSSTLSSQKRS